MMAARSGSAHARNVSAFAQQVVSAVLDGETFGRMGLPAENEAVEVIPGALIGELIAGKRGDLDRPVIRINGVLIDGDIDLSYCDWRGELNLGHCRITGILSLAHSAINGSIYLDGCVVNELNTSYSSIQGAVFFRDGSCARGLFGLGMQISGALNLRQSELWAPEDRPNRCAVELFRTKIGDIFMTRAILHGGLYANGMSVDGISACKAPESFRERPWAGPLDQTVAVAR